MISLDQLADRARMLMHGDGRAILGITGMPGAGKSTLASSLLDILRPAPPRGLPVDDWVAHVPMDGFHLADGELDRLGKHDRKGAPDTFDSAGYLSVLHRIKKDTPGIVYAPSFERALEQPLAGRIPVLPTARLIITEGNYLLLSDGVWPQIRALLDEVWYLNLPDDARLERLVDRHLAYGKSPDAATAWARGSDQANAELVASTRDRADLLVQLSNIDPPLVRVPPTQRG